MKSPAMRWRSTWRVCSRALSIVLVAVCAASAQTVSPTHTDPILPTKSPITERPITERPTTERPITERPITKGSLDGRPKRYRALALQRFAIKDMRGAFGWRDLRIGSRLLRMLLTHAPRLSRFKDAAHKLEALTWDGFAPWRGETKGVDPRRGIFLFWNRAGGYRLLISHRPERSRAALAETRAFAEGALGIKWGLTCSKGDSGERSRESRWVVCDSPNIESAPPPYWLTSSLDRGAFWFFLQAPKISQPFVLPWENVEAHVDLSEEDLKLSISLGAGFNHLLEIFRPQSELSSVNTWVHERSPLAFKLSIDPKVLRRVGAFARESAWVNHALKLMDAGWSGEVLLTFDGGLDHPVIALSLTPDPWSADKLSATLSGLIGARSATRKERLEYERLRERDRGLSWWLIRSDTPTQSDPAWRIPILKTPKSLLIGLFPADLRRRTADKFRSYQAPISIELDQRGVSGGFLDPAIFELNSLSGGRVHLNTLYAALIQLWREGGEGLIDVPRALAGESHSSAGSLARLARFESEHLVTLFSPLTSDGELFMALSDLTSLALQLTEVFEWTIYSYTQTETGGIGLGLDLRWVIL